MLKNTIWFLIGIILIVNVNADFEWMYLRKYGSNVTLKPLAPLDKNDTILTTFIKSECRWLLPDFKTYLWPNVVNTDAKSRYKINLNDCSLEITSINEEDNGIYHVFLNGTDTNENGTYVTKAMLNYHGPPYDSFIDEYRYNLIAGFSTFGGILAFAVFVYIIKDYSYSSRLKKVEAQNITSNEDEVVNVKQEENKTENQVSSF